jgi:carbon monoxide dehydrogenase subunit G
MLISNEFDVPVETAKVWEFFGDIPRVAACLPGAQLTEDHGDDSYAGTVAIRMGPVRLSFTGTADITERDETARRLVVKASGADERGRGQAAMLVTATLHASGAGTRVAVSQDLQLSGAAAQYGRGMISDVSSVLMRDFAANMRRQIEGGPAAKAAPAQGFTLALRAASLALRRVFRRFFLPYEAPSPQTPRST